MEKLFELFITFIKVGTFGFGGGNAVIPLIEREVVENLGWMTPAEYTDSVAFGSSLPGPIATKLAAIIGYRMAGLPGVFVSILSLLVPSTILVVLVFSTYQKHKDEAWLKGAMMAVRPVVTALIFIVVLTMGKVSLTAPVFMIIGLIAFIAVYYLNIHPVLLIALSMIFGGFFLK